MKNHREIFEALLAGNKLTAKEFNIITYIKMATTGELAGNIVDNYGDFFYPNFEDYKFKIYEPPKEKVKLYQWAYRIEGGLWTISSHFYSNESDFESNCIVSSAIKKIKRLDHTMIEVER